MTSYVKTTDFLVKDSLLSGDPAKIVKGSEIDAEFNALQTADATNAKIDDVQTLTNKTINLTSNTLTGTTAQFNTALSDGNFATQAGTETLTNKSIDLASNTVTGTTAQFNTALSDGNFATQGGTETLTNKTFSDAVKLAEIATPATPATGFVSVYAKSDGLLYVLDDAGVERTTTTSDASTTVKGIVELATEAEVITGTSATLVPSVDSFRKANIVSGTTVASTSGTAIDFTGFPSWVKRITILAAGISVSGTSFVQVQIGSGSFLTTGYLGTNSYTTNVYQYVSGFAFQTNAAAAHASSARIVLEHMGSNVWVESHLTSFTNVAGVAQYGSGHNTLSGTLDRIRITTVNGTDTFDAGSINILYE